jgi:hypothetical protein
LTASNGGPRYLSPPAERPGLFTSWRVCVAVLLAGALFWAIVGLALYFAATAIGRPRVTAVELGLSASTIAFWDGVAKCETGSSWRGLGSTYQGGLGIYSRTWDWWAGELGLDRRYPDAGDAPRLVQIRVADYGRRVHNGGWGCL